MDPLLSALRGARHDAPQAPPLQPLQTALVVGAGGTLGSALLAEALAAGRFQRVGAAVAGPLRSALRGFEPFALGAPPAADLGFVVFERARHSNGRDDAFVQPAPEELPAVAAALRAAGVRRLVVVVPHAPALLPHALKAGFANEAERSVAALGFEHCVFLRAAQAAAPAAGSRLDRFAAWWLSQLAWMVPASEQPLRAVVLAALAVELARRLPQAPPGTRVLAPETLRAAAEAADPGPLLDAGLAAGAPP